MFNYLISVVGATAIGKTALSIHLAKHFETEIISCDSRQFYKEMNIGTAVPSIEELAAVKHHFIQNRSIFDDYSVGQFEKDALQKINQDGLKRKQVGVILNCDPLTGPNTTFWEILKDNQQVGKITSAVYSPRLKQNIALAMVTINNSEIGTVLDVKMNDKIIKATVVEKPFYDPKKKLASS